ncbi:hypothetical protein ABB37_03026 [Leptomonas pyrrhocoris]|uniref:Uncharacterized protein n=1 Tax=Leptomonas pyrrhocoris TaxID=157538 RepID=A0A0N0DXZ5_LEPPY|nr:hypothetical protein ABB37_03026 [Leptomonas pyrrhocoris]KPA83382.1 hypothetical protein ABB37_03026 [Leptomonas pyrrhocoris]|eukprot:XP_015661821.1 hypothetical protein ABB37_03026 [Leptomonas pyrrhocoris]
MHISANSLVRFGLVAIGISGAGLGGRYVYNVYEQRHPARNDRLLQLAAIALSGEVISKALNDAEVQEQLRVFGLQLLTHPVVVAELKKFFIRELTTDTPTRAALRAFVVRDIIKDEWVKEELIGVAENLVDSVKDNPDLYPSRVLSWLGGCALEGMRRDEFKAAVRASGKKALWIAFIGPPPPDTPFDPPF